MEQDKFEFDVFLSHKSSDKPLVLRLAERLQDSGVRVWFDDWILKPGDDIYLTIEKGLEVSRALVLCISEAALQSDWVGLERSTVLFRDPSNTGRRFIPLLLSDCQLPDTLKRFKYLDFTRESDTEFKKLLAACRPDDNKSYISYTYPDPNDEVTFATIQSLEPEPGYWSLSDGNMRREFLNQTLGDFNQRHGLTGIDVGCGYGRLIPWLLDEYCSRGTALEPDRARLAAAKSGLDPDKRDRVMFVEKTIQDFVSQSAFDLILCSHLIQHVQRAQLHVILSKLRSLCAQDARVILFTTHSTIGDEYYVKAFLSSDSSYREDSISPGEFDRLLGDRFGVLPIRFFSLKTLEYAFKKAGFRIMDYYVYHCCEGNFGDLEKYCFRDRIINSLPELKERFGRDLALIAEPVPLDTP